MTTIDQTYTVLVVDDEPDLRALYLTTLQRAGYTVLCADGVTAAKTCLNQHADIACVVTDYRMPDGTGIELAQHIAQSHTGLPVSIMTAYGSPDHAVLALKAGAFDYLSKPVSIADLRSTVAQMLAQNHLRQRDDPAALLAQLMHLLPGQSPAMQQVHQLLAKCTHTQACVAIDGESGTGKELAARAIHLSSVRRAQPFIVFNGANDRDGSTGISALHTAFQQAQGGTLLLESVEALAQASQLALLNVLQDRHINNHHVTSTTLVPVDVRLIVSSKLPLTQLLEAGVLRQELFYRLNVLTLNLPPLHLRDGDAVWLAQRWLAQHPQGKTLTLSVAAIHTLNSHRFTGNVRELENVLERSVALHSRQASTTLDIALIDVPRAGNTVLHERLSGSSDVQASAAAMTPSIAVSLPLDLATHLANTERSIIEQALQQCRYNRTQAAALLGLNLRQMRYRMEQLGIND